jgi:hypothetical protein
VLPNIQSAPEIPDGFLNVITIFPATRRFHTNIRRVECSVEMEHWSVTLGIVVVELFIRTESITVTQRGFRLQFETRDAPSRKPLLLWVSKWRQEGSVKDSKTEGRPRSVRTAVNAE